MSAKKRFLETVKRKVEHWKREVERLQADANRMDRRDMRQYSATVQDIIARIQRIENQFVIDDHTSVDTWQALKRRVEDGSRDIDNRIRQARDQFIG